MSGVLWRIGAGNLIPRTRGAYSDFTASSGAADSCVCLCPKPAFHLSMPYTEQTKG
jgi:hypothetical protein